MPYLQLDKEQFESLLKWMNVFYLFRDTGFANPNNDMKSDMRLIFADLFHQHLNTDCPSCLARGFNLLFDKMEQYQALHKPLEISENASKKDQNCYGSGQINAVKEKSADQIKQEQVKSILSIHPITIVTVGVYQPPK